MTIFQKIAYWYFTKKALPYWGIALLDCLAIFCSGCLVAILTDGAVATILQWKALGISMIVYELCYMLGMRLLHTYAGVIRHSSFVDLQRVGVANLIGLAFTFPIRILLAHQRVAVLGYYDLVAIFFMATFLMWAFRVTVKFFYEMEFKSSRAKRVFIYGTKNGGISLAKSIHGAENRRYILAGFVSGDKKYLNKRLMGVRVVKDDLNLVEEMKLRGATVLLVSPLYSDQFRTQTELVDKLIEANIHIHMMPPTVQWDGKSALQYEALREVQIEDLLPRDKIEVDMEKVGQMLTGKRILITGAAGSIGSEMVRQIAAFDPAELVLIDQAETPMHDVRIFLSKNITDALILK